MNLIYLFKEKSTNEIIYVGSSSRPSARMKEHIQTLKGDKQSNQKIYKYMNSKNLKFYIDVEVIWVDCADTVSEMRKKEEEYYFKYIDTVKNDRPGEYLLGKYSPKRRSVKCINDGMIFDTVTECAKYYGKVRTTIQNVLIKEQPYTNINDEHFFF